MGGRGGGEWLPDTPSSLPPPPGLSHIRDSFFCRRFRPFKKKGEFDRSIRQGSAAEKLSQALEPLSRGCFLFICDSELLKRELLFNLCAPSLTLPLKSPAARPPELTSMPLTRHQSHWRAATRCFREVLLQDFRTSQVFLFLSCRDASSGHRQ